MGTEGLADAIGLVGAHIVHVDTAGGIRLGRLPETADPILDFRQVTLMAGNQTDDRGA